MSVNIHIRMTLDQKTSYYLCSSICVQFTWNLMVADAGRHKRRFLARSNLLEETENQPLEQQNVK